MEQYFRGSNFFSGGSMRLNIVLILSLGVFYGDAGAQQVLTLNECVTIALENNSQILNAGFALNTSKAQKLASFSNILPSISLNGGPSRFHRGPSTRTGYGPGGSDPETGDVIYGATVQVSPSNTVTDYNMGINLSQTLWDQGKMMRNIQQAESSVRASSRNEEAAKITVIATVKSNYYEFAKVIAQREVRVESVQLAEEQLNQSQVKYEIGTVAQIDVFRSRVLLDQSKIALIDHDLLIHQAKNNLNLAMGRDIEASLEIDSDIPLAISYRRSNEELVQLAFRNNATIKQQDELLLNSDFGIKIAKADRYPSLNYNVSYSRSNSQFDLLYNDFSRNFSINGRISLSYNLFDGFQTRANIKQAENTYRINEENLELAKRNAESNVTILNRQLLAYEEKIVINRSMVAAAEEDLRLANERYRVGSGTLYETIDAQVSLTAARYSLLELQYNSLTAESNLKAQLGETGLER
jgi:outer membrane protein